MQVGIGTGLDFPAQLPASGGAFDVGDALLLDDGVSFLLLGGTTDKLLLAPQ